MNSKWTPEMDGELTQRRRNGENFAKIAVAMHLPKAAAIGRAQRLGLDPTDWTSSERFYEMKPTKHSPRKQGRPPKARTTYAEKRMQVEPPPPPPPPKPFRSPVQDEWPLTMCAELPLRVDHDYEPVN